MFTLRRVVSRRVLLSFFLLFFLLFLLLKVYINSSFGLASSTFINAAKHDAKAGRKKVDLVVVEEHHEVLEYWFDAANKGIIPKSGNVLVHIDAHSDMAPPELIENYPFFRWPKSKDEVKAMMQSNDVFIQAAAMSGLFKTVIWVWPSWDEDTHGEDDISHIFGGGSTELTIDGEKERTFCECEFKKDGVTKNHCFYVNRTAFVDENYDGTEIDARKCQILGSIEYREIVDYNALIQLLSGNLVKEGESLLLDIDQDFFGCVLRGQSLVDVGMEWNEVEEIDEMLNDIFCPKVTRHEGLAHDFMQKILTLVITKCKRKQSDKNNCLNPPNKAFRNSFDSIIKSARDMTMFCESTAKDRKKKLDLLVEGLISFNTRQLKAIADLGFCMQTSPRSYEGPGFQMCHGANEPNSTVVTVHMPGENELRLRLARLRRIVEAKNYPTPGMVTLCRSVRDGYSPVPYFTTIEKGIIESVRNSRPGMAQYNVVYDKNLLGGKKGWPARQRRDHLVKQSKPKRRRRKSIFPEFN